VREALGIGWLVFILHTLLEAIVIYQVISEISHRKIAKLSPRGPEWT